VAVVATVSAEQVCHHRPVALDHGETVEAVGEFE
jgi:hypothetical protein